MSTFKDYSHYYDLLYFDKDYIAEVDYIYNSIKTNCALAKSVLNLGCGTGKHDLILANKDLDITAIDISQEMIDLARGKANPNKIEFLQGDIKYLKLNKNFDVVISLFHVISYQISEEDLLLTFKTAYDHLNSGGLFIFDFWYGPAVLTDRPEVRIKRVENENYKIVRLSEPTMVSESNCVDVNFNLYISDKGLSKNIEISEKHTMRYWFKPEIEYFLEQVGFKTLKAEQWLTGEELNYHTWYACFQVQKI